MARFTPRLTLAAALTLSLVGGCNSEPPPTTQAVDSGPITVATTFYPTTYFAQRIAGDLARVTCPVPAGADPIFWQPTAEDIGAFQSADLIVLNTCVVRQSAENKATGRLSSLKSVKRHRPHTAIVVMGCLVHDDLAALQRQFPHVEAFLKPSDVAGLRRGASTYSLTARKSWAILWGSDSGCRACGSSVGGRVMDLNGKTVVVTGAGSGIGRALAIAFAQSGGNVVCCGRRKERLGETVSIVEDSGAAGLPHQPGDV